MCLSERINDTNCAPWVIEEIRKLEAELDAMAAQLQGPDGFATWKDAAVDERIRRVAAEKREQALAAHVEYLTSFFDEAERASLESPSTSLANLKPQWQAEDEPKQISMGGCPIWQDAAGTIPVTKDGDPVGRVGCDQTGETWTAHGMSRPVYREYPAEPEWDGEGLPPVGVECEYRLRGKWEAAKVVGHNGPACVVEVDGEGYFGNAAPGAFRPIRTAEDKAVEEMALLLADEFDATANDCIDAARALYRSGYRRQAKEVSDDCSNIIREVEHCADTASRRCMYLANGEWHPATLLAEDGNVRWIRYNIYQHGPYYNTIDNPNHIHFTD